MDLNVSDICKDSDEEEDVEILPEVEKSPIQELETTHNLKDLVINLERLNNDIKENHENLSASDSDSSVDR